MRLEITAQDRLGIVQDILDILVRQQIDLRGIEVDEGYIFLNFPTISFDDLQGLMPQIRLIDGVNDVKTIDFMPCEQRRSQYNTLLKSLSDPVILLDSAGNISTVNDKAMNLIGATTTQLINQPIHIWVDDLDLNDWTLGDSHPVINQKVQCKNQSFYAEVQAVYITADDGNDMFSGTLITLKTELNQAKKAVHIFDDELDSFNRFSNKSPAMRKTVRQARKMANVDAPMLIVGETGTGKELLARACHKSSLRQEKPFLVLNCASLPDEMAETELFGCGKGVYDSEGKKGLLDLAAGGTLFLDEVGDMSETLQTKLLRFLTDGSFRRVGDEKECHVDVRIICSTHKDLDALVTEKAFRKDLYYRLNVLTLMMPPLRERRNDVLPLADYFVKKISEQLDRETPHFSETCKEYVVGYPWPGNVRQLENAIYRAVSLLDGNTLNNENFKLPNYQNTANNIEAELNGSLEEAVKRFESGVLRQMYPTYPSTRQLAKKLGLSHTAVANKLREYGINKKTVKTI